MLKLKNMFIYICIYMSPGACFFLAWWPPAPQVVDCPRVAGVQLMDWSTR